MSVKQGHTGPAMHTHNLASICTYARREKTTVIFRAQACMLLYGFNWMLTEISPLSILFHRGTYKIKKIQLTSYCLDFLISLIAVICSPFFWEGLVSLAVWSSGSLLGFSSVGFGCFWVSVVDTGTGAVAGVVVLLLVGFLSAVGANGPLSPVPASGLCVWGWTGLGAC